MYFPLIVRKSQGLGTKFNLDNYIDIVYVLVANQFDGEFLKRSVKGMNHAFDFVPIIKTHVWDDFPEDFYVPVNNELIEKIKHNQMEVKPLKKIKADIFKALSESKCVEDSIEDEVSGKILELIEKKLYETTALFANCLYYKKTKTTYKDSANNYMRHIKYFHINRNLIANLFSRQLSKIKLIDINILSEDELQWLDKTSCKGFNYFHPIWYVPSHDIIVVTLDNKFTLYPFRLYNLYLGIIIGVLFSISCQRYYLSKSTGDKRIESGFSPRLTVDNCRVNYSFYHIIAYLSNLIMDCIHVYYSFHGKGNGTILKEFDKQLLNRRCQGFDYLSYLDIDLLIDMILLGDFEREWKTKANCLIYLRKRIKKIKDSPLKVFRRNLGYNF